MLASELLTFVEALEIDPERSPARDRNGRGRYGIDDHRPHCWHLQRHVDRKHSAAGTSQLIRWRHLSRDRGGDRGV
jgi:hypothetical protein